MTTITATQTPEPQSRETVPMTLAHKILNLIFVPLPLVGLIVAVVLLWHRGIGPLELGLMVGLYTITCLGTTLGYHRLFTHRSFETSPALRAAVAILGSLAVEGSTTASTMPTPTARATRTHRSSPAQASGAPSRGCGTPTWAGSGRPSARPTACGSPPI
jgi:hypothetical protein